MVERILVVGPKDTISMVDDLAPKGFEIVKALHNSPEQKAALPGAHYFVGFVQQYVNEDLYKQASAAPDDKTRLDFLRQIQVFWPEYRDVAKLVTELEQKPGP